MRLIETENEFYEKYTVNFALFQIIDISSIIIMQIILTIISFKLEDVNVTSGESYEEEGNIVADLLRDSYWVIIMFGFVELLFEIIASIVGPMLIRIVIGGKFKKKDFYGDALDYIYKN